MCPAFASGLAIRRCARGRSSSSWSWSRGRRRSRAHRPTSFTSARSRCTSMACCTASRSWWRSRSYAAAGWREAAHPRWSTTSRCGVSRPASSAGACTTSRPRRATRSSTGGGRWPSGRVGWGSGAGSRSARSSASGASGERSRRRRLPGRGGAGATGRAGDRAHRQLLQPGAVRAPDGRAVGAGDRPGAPAGALPRRADISPDVPVDPWRGSGGRGGASRCAGAGRGRRRSRRRVQGLP